VLKRWLAAHMDDPYPNSDRKAALAAESGLSYDQVQHWLINARMRKWRPLIRKRKEEEEDRQQAQRRVEEGAGWTDREPARDGDDGEQGERPQALSLAGIARRFEQRAAAGERARRAERRGKRRAAEEKGERDKPESHSDNSLPVLPRGGGSQ
jgi:hypothetical protein